MPLITPTKPPRPRMFGDSPSASRGWKIEAGSGPDAQDILRTQTGFDFQSVYADENGFIDDQNLVLQSFEVFPESGAPTGGTGLYTVNAYYSYNQFRGRSNVDLVLGAVRIRVDDVTVSRPAQRTYDGKPIHNTVGEPLSGLTDEDNEGILTVEWLTPATSYTNLYATFRPYRGKVNDRVFYGAGIGDLKFLKATIEDAYISPSAPNGPGIFHVKVQLHDRNSEEVAGHHVEGWEDYTYNMGYRKRVGTNPNGSPKYENIVDDKGKPIGTPVMLLADGTDEANPANPVYVSFKHHKGYANLGAVVPNAT